MGPWYNTLNNNHSFTEHLQALEKISLFHLSLRSEASMPRSDWLRGPSSRSDWLRGPSSGHTSWWSRNRFVLRLTGVQSLQVCPGKQARIPSGMMDTSKGASLDLWPGQSVPVETDESMHYQPCGEGPSFEEQTVQRDILLRRYFNTSDSAANSELYSRPLTSWTENQPESSVDESEGLEPPLPLVSDANAYCTQYLPGVGPRCPRPCMCRHPADHRDCLQHPHARDVMCEAVIQHPNQSDPGPGTKETKWTVSLPEEYRNVFVTYSVDIAVEMTPFTKFLTSHGFKPAIDIFDSPIRRMGITRWMDRFLNDQSVVIIVAISPKYKEVVEGDGNDEHGMHTKYIHNQIQNEFIQQGCLNFRFIPVLFPNTTKEHVPRWLQNTRIYKWPQDTQDLLLRLLRKERYIIPHTETPLTIKVIPL
ncbi:E3 ubiquitin ligase TRAF3IP2 [Entelurus aequoreus]|uniref:E3 ubiquitin ligase TRAF3IP2 n=1 Tax=Entelurus aequoreus TaxID=161455 RepID=UPI002B1E50CE|nr:E3 ubiquitin ligase TRAF3IP2 [Entelurus aequoreus]